MTGKEEKFRKCPLCRGRMKDGITNLPFLMGERTAVIRNVPSEICSECGEPYMKSSVVSKIEVILDRLEELESEVSVIRYKAA